MNVRTTQRQQPVPIGGGGTDNVLASYRTDIRTIIIIIIIIIDYLPVMLDSAAEQR